MTSGRALFGKGCTRHEMLAPRSATMASNLTVRPSERKTVHVASDSSEIHKVNIIVVAKAEGGEIIQPIGCY